MSPELAQKLDLLRSFLKDTGGCAVAYSGGVDSTLLLHVAREVLGLRCLAVIAVSPTYPEEETQAAIEWLKGQGIPLAVVQSEELEIPGFRDNPPDRCYHCKKDLFGKVWAEANRAGLGSVAEGANADDTKDFRPGMRAAKELCVLQPLREAGLTKSEIRELARDIYHLPVWDKPSMACLASRFPYGSSITDEKLKQVDAMERFLKMQGFRVVRARHHGDILRLELDSEGMIRALKESDRQAVIERARSLGFTYVTLDLEGYRTGSMNEVLDL